MKFVSEKSFQTVFEGFIIMGILNNFFLSLQPCPVLISSGNTCFVVKMPLKQHVVDVLKIPGKSILVNYAKKGVFARAIR